MKYRVRVMFLGRKHNQGGFFEDFKTKRAAMRFYRMLRADWTNELESGYIILFEAL